MKSVIVDIGNSSVRAARWDDDTAQQPGSVLATGPGQASSPLPALGEWTTPGDDKGSDFLAGVLAEILSAEQADQLVLVSVVPRVAERLGRALPGCRPIDHRSALPFVNGVAEPAAVGADRYCNVAAACFAGLADALVVDSGTATTFDILRDGEFIGGLIAPGMAFAAASLGERAARLDSVRFGPGPLSAGRDTASAMSSGAYHVGRHGVLGTIVALRQVYGDLPVILTGGLGGVLDLVEWPYDRDWTLRGAALLARKS